MTTVTLLFTDLVGSTEILARLGDDAAETLRRRHFAILREAVAAQGGLEVKNLGDGLMVVFRSAVDAVACAVAMQRSIAHHNATERGARLQVRVGLHVGEPIRDEDDYFGMPVVIAERLCGRAGAGQIIASEPVRELASARGTFDFRSLGPIELKGVAVPVAASEVAWEPPAGSMTGTLPPELALGEHSFFVSRDAELERLTYAWKEAAAGTPRAVLIAGEAGIGKTSLAGELARRAHEEGWTVLFGRCDEEPGLTYQPFAEALRGYVSTSSPEELRAFLPADLANLVRIVPDLAGRVPGLPEPPRGDRESERYRMFESVVRVVAGASRRAPVLLVLDDLHWAAKPSLLLLRHLVRAAGSTTLLIVATYRDSEVHRGHPIADVLADLRREPAVERLSLDGLDAAGVAAFVAATAGHELEPDEAALAETLHRETEGNPFFLREILQHLFESGVLDRTGGKGRVQLDLSEIGIPEGVREVVGRRLSALSPEANRALSVAAIVGPTFSFALLDKVVDGDSDELLDVLDEAVVSRVIVETRDRPGSYSFSHALVRQVLLAELSSARRVRQHLRVGEALEAQPSRDESLSALAHHFAEGGEPSKAGDYALAAAARAADELAFEEAGSHLERGLRALELADPADHARTADLLLALAEARLDSGDVTGHKDATRHAADAARAAGSAERLGQAAALHMHLSVVGTPDPAGATMCESALEALGSDHPALQARVLAGLAYYRALSESQGIAASELAQEALDLARTAGDPDALALALFVRAICLTGSVQVHERIRLADELLELAAATGDLFHRSQGLRVRAPARLELTDIAGFEADVAALEQVGAELRSWFCTALAAEWKALRAMMCGRFADAQVHADEVMEHGGREQNFVNVWTTQMFFLYRELGRLSDIYPVAKPAIDANPGIVAFTAGLALMQLELGMVDEATAVYEDIAAGEFAVVPRDGTWTACMTVLTEVCVALGDAGRARVLYDLFLPRRGSLAVWVWGVACAGAVDRYLGMLAATMGDAALAAEHFEAALAHEDGIGARPLVARTRYWFGRLLVESTETDLRDRGRLLLEESRRSADELGMAALALDAAGTAT